MKKPSQMIFKKKNRHSLIRRIKIIKWTIEKTFFILIAVKAAKKIRFKLEKKQKVN